MSEERCDMCWNVQQNCICVTYEGVHGHSYAHGRHTPSGSLHDDWGLMPHKTWWGCALKSAKDESERLAAKYPGSRMWFAWRKHYLVMRNDLSQLGLRYDFAPIEHPTPWACARPEQRA